MPTAAGCFEGSREWLSVLGFRGGRWFRSSGFNADAVPINTPIHVADYFRRSGPISFDVKYDVPEGSTPEYYLRRITVAAKRLGIDLSGGEPG